MLKLIVAIFFASVAAQDWCTIPYCEPGTHIACNHDGQFASTCVSPTQVRLNSVQIQSILNTHNQWRSNTAGGIVQGYEGVFLPQAVRMGKMQWNSQLAQLAELNTKQCEMEHDQCRSTDQYYYAGQNLYSFATTAPTINVTSTVVNAVHAWAGESAYTRVSDIDEFTTLDGGDGEAIGHYTVLANELSTHVGCALSFYKDINGWNWALFACNYAYTNMLGRRVYLSGPATSQCSTGRDGIYPNLCTINEYINPNEFIYRENIY